ncbi:MAG: MinD/ParA family protein [Sedimenticola sp.]
MASMVSASLKTAVLGQLPDTTEDPAAEKSGDANHAHVVAVSSGKGGVGKTCISTNLSIALAAQGKRVCLFDADTSLANVNILLGLSPEYTLEHYVKNERSIDDILVEAPGGVQIVPGATGIGEFIQLSAGQQKHLIDGLKHLEQKFDYLVIDTEAGISEALIQFLLAAPYMVVTITQEPTSLTDAFSLLKVLKRHDFDAPVFVIVNMAQNRASAHETYHRFKGAVAKYLGLEIYYLSFIFADPKVPESIRAQKPYLLEYPESLASRCLENATMRLAQVLERKPGGKSFSEYFQSISLEEDEVDLREEEGTDTVEEASSEVDERSYDQAVEELLGRLRDYFFEHPEQTDGLSGSIMQMMEPGAPVAEPVVASEAEASGGSRVIPPSLPGAEEMQRQELETACRFAARLSSITD